MKGTQPGQEKEQIACLKGEHSICMQGNLSLAWPTCRGWKGKVGSLSSQTLNMHDVCFYLIGPKILIELAFTV